MEDYSTFGERVELIIRDFSGAKVDSFKWSMKDKKTEGKIHYILRKKYGLFRSIDHKPSDDLGWLKKTDY